MVKYDSHYVTSRQGETVILIRINQYDPTQNDFLDVSIHGLRAIPDMDYTVDHISRRIQLSKDLDAAQTVSFLNLKSIASVDVLSMIEILDGLQKETKYHRDCVYDANGSNDNILLSNIVCSFLDGKNEFRMEKITRK